MELELKKRHNAKQLKISQRCNQTILISPYDEEREKIVLIKRKLEEVRENLEFFSLQTE